MQTMQTEYKHLSTKRLIKIANNNDDLAQQEVINRFMINGLDFGILKLIDILKWKNIFEKCCIDQKYVFVLLSFHYHTYNIEQKLTGDNLINKLLPIIKSEAKSGNALAQNNLGFLYFYTHNSTKNVKKGLKWLDKAADQNLTYALCNLGIIYYNGKYVSSNYEKAITHISKDIELSNSSASESIMAGFYYNGHGVERNYLIAHDWYIKAAKKNSSFAQYKLHEMYLYGYGVKRNTIKALYWLNLAFKNYDQNCIVDMINKFWYYGDKSQYIYWCFKKNLKNDLKRVFNIQNITSRSPFRINICALVYAEANTLFQNNSNEILTKCQLLIIKNKYNEVNEHSIDRLKYCDLIEKNILSMMKFYDDISQAPKSKFMISCLSFFDKTVSKKINNYQTETKTVPYVKQFSILEKNFINFGFKNNKLMDDIMQYGQTISCDKKIFEEKFISMNKHTQNNFEMIRNLFNDLEQHYESLLNIISKQHSIRDTQFAQKNKFLF
ncbi:putative Sel1-like repeat-containing protein [Cotonvirus japonicus]|uniref:Sel1-like repeat-containing protein n=1 Tax=Cotonvirus japonicus TaxID=2811091 RepID=A0ABM7NRI6_9VIRU|nr:putative Sel1-like repeat-containing protein [Cotonvirus japonicus]BCS82764.1 putative Sel1-like repeat-containing protein [Cotonvirus japonicus]